MPRWDEWWATVRPWAASEFGEKVISVMEPLFRDVYEAGVASERSRVGAKLRAEAGKLAGKAWFHPQFSLEELADEVQKGS